MQSVNVNCVEVYPCAYWKRLIRIAESHNGSANTGFEKSTWPPHSSTLCWNCCHSFDNVPSFYPVDLDAEKNVFFFMGNFCSWNCVKGYALKLNDQRKPQGTSYISLLAFLTVHRPLKCLYSRTEQHPYNCPCLEEFKGVSLPPKKELLKAFGGHLSIDEYRKNFMKIEKYDWVMEYFHKNNKIMRELGSLTLTQKRRAYTFCFVSYPGPSEATVDHLYLLPLTHKTLPKAKKAETKPDDGAKHTLKTLHRSNPAGRRRFPKNNAPEPSMSSKPSTEQHHHPKSPEQLPPPPTIEPVVSEEQAFYISSVHKYGNLMSSMGITIQKKSS